MSKFVLRAEDAPFNAVLVPSSGVNRAYFTQSRKCIPEGVPAW